MAPRAVVVSFARRIVAQTGSPRVRRGSDLQVAPERTRSNETGRGLMQRPGMGACLPRAS